MWEFFLAMSAGWAQQAGTAWRQTKAAKRGLLAVELGSAFGSLESEAGVAETKRYVRGHTAVVCLCACGLVDLTDFHKKTCTKAKRRREEALKGYEQFKSDPAHPQADKQRSTREAPRRKRPAQVVQAWCGAVSAGPPLSRALPLPPQGQKPPTTNSGQPPTSRVRQLVSQDQPGSHVLGKPRNCPSSTRPAPADDQS